LWLPLCGFPPALFNHNSKIARYEGGSQGASTPSPVTTWSRLITTLRRSMHATQCQDEIHITAALRYSTA